MKKWKLILIASFVLLIAAIAKPGPHDEGNRVLANTVGQEGQAGPVEHGLQGPAKATTLVRVYFAAARRAQDAELAATDFERTDLYSQILISFDVLETNYEEGYHLLAATQQEIARLTAAGIRVEIEPNRALDQYFQPRAVPLAQTEAIPGFACYRTVEEAFATAQSIANTYPTLATWTDQGDSWEKTAGQGGYDMLVLKLTNSAIPGPNPNFSPPAPSTPASTPRPN